MNNEQLDQLLRDNGKLETNIENSLPTEADKAAFRIGLGTYKPGDFIKFFEPEQQ